MGVDRGGDCTVSIRRDELEVMLMYEVKRRIVNLAESGSTSVRQR